MDAFYQLFRSSNVTLAAEFVRLTMRTEIFSFSACACLVFRISKDSKAPPKISLENVFETFKLAMLFRRNFILNWTRWTLGLMTRVPLARHSKSAFD